MCVMYKCMYNIYAYNEILLVINNKMMPFAMNETERHFAKRINQKQKDKCYYIHFYVKSKKAKLIEAESN